MSQRELEFFVAGLAPKSPSRDTIRVIHPVQIPAPLPEEGEAKAVDGKAALQPLSGAPSAMWDRVRPVTQELARISFTADQETVRDIERACALLRCRRSSLGPLIARAVRLLLREIDPDVRLAHKQHRQSRPGDPEARRIPQAVRDAVWRRDGGQCVFRDNGGRRCGARSGLEFDHIRPWSAGGSSTDPDNVRLLCRAHNQAAARRWFGTDAMAEAIATARLERDSALEARPPPGG